MNEKAIQSALGDIIRAVVEELNRPNAASSAVTVPAEEKVVPVELSARHAHLSAEDVQTLFGAPLTPVRELSQPGQFLCKERVRLIGPKGVMDNVAVLGPARSASQVEISKTDARSLGVNVPVRQSGDTAKTPGIILASLDGFVPLEEGLIVAARHIHMTPADAKCFGVSDGDLVDVRLEGERPIILEDVVVRVHESFKLAMHIDSDEGNSSGWKNNLSGIILERKKTHGLCRH